MSLIPSLSKKTKASVVDNLGMRFNYPAHYTFKDFCDEFQEP